MSWQEAYLDRFYGSPRARRRHDVSSTRCAQHTSRPEPRFWKSAPVHRTRLRDTLPLSDACRDWMSIRRCDRMRLWRTRVCWTRTSYPFADSCFDACVSNYVLEHVADPGSHLSEISRILRPGGVYLFRTPNRYHYVSLVSRLTPHWFHEAVANRLRNLGEEAPDPYPTYYRLNSRRAIHRAAAQAGLHVRELRMVEKEPSYGMASRLLFVIFMLYERAVNSSGLFAALRANVFGVLERP